MKKGSIIKTVLLSAALTGCITANSISSNSSTYQVTAGSSTVVTVTNSGNQTANNITVTNSLPSGVSATSCSAAPSGTCSFTISATSGATPRTGIPLIIGGSNTITSNAKLDILSSGSVTISLNSATYTVAQNGSVQVTVTNAGSQTANNVTVTNSLPSGVTATSCSAAPSGTCNFAISATSGATPQSGISLSVAGSNTTTVNPTLTVTAATSTTITSDDTTYSVSLGGTTYVAVTNTGSSTATNVTIASGLPAGITATSCASIAPGATCIFSLYNASPSSSLVYITGVNIAGDNTNSIAVSVGLVKTTGPSSNAFPGAQINAAVVSSTSATAPSTVYLATNGTGVFYRFSGGNTWTPLNNTGLPTSALSPISIVVDLSNHVFISTWTGAIYEWASGTWTPITVQNLAGQPAILAVDAHNYLYVLAYNATNSTYSAQYLNLGSQSSGWQTISGISSPINLVSNSDGVVAYLDNGATHIYTVASGAITNNITPPSSLPGDSYNLMAISPGSSGTIYFDYLQSGGGKDKISYYSGGTWNPIVTGNLPTARVRVLAPIDGSGSFYALDYDNYIYSNIYSAPPINKISPVYASNPPSLSGAAILTFTQGSSPKLYFGAGQGILTYDISGQTWSVDNSGFSTAPMTASYVDPSNNANIFAGMISTTLSLGSPLNLAYDSSGSAIVGTMTGTNSLYATTVESFAEFNSKSYAATDVGVFQNNSPVWKFESGPTLGGQNNGGPYIEDLATGSFNGSSYLFAIDHSSTAAVAYTSNGNSWLSTNALLDAGDSLTALYLLNGVLYAGTNNGKLDEMSGTIGGWGQLSNTGITGGPIRAMAADGPGNLYITTGDGQVYQCSTTSKVSCSAISNAPSGLTGAIFHSNQSNSALYVGTETGVYALPGGGSFTKIYSGSPVNEISGDAGNNNLYLATPKGLVQVLTH